MATPSSGEFKLQDIVTEFGGDAPHGLTEYYAGGSNVGSGTQNAQGQAVPSSGEIKLTDFYGTSNTFAMNYLIVAGGGGGGVPSVVEVARYACRHCSITPEVLHYK